MGWTIGALILALGVIVWGPLASRVEQPPYRVLEQQGDIEIREYGPQIVAEVRLPGGRKAALEQGFRILAGYIFGDNYTGAKVAMTAPVTESGGRRIAMTAPVTAQQDGALFSVRFGMPAGATLESLPKPRNPAIELKQIPARRIVAIRFAGLAGEASLERHTRELQGFLAQHALTALSEPVAAYYNPPWTLPPLRRNEVWVEVAPSTA